MSDDQIAKLSKLISNLESNMDGRLKNLESNMDGRLKNLESNMDGRLKNLESNMVTQDQFKKLFIYTEKRFSEIESKLDEKASQFSVDSLTNTIDGYAARLSDFEAEQVATKIQYDRLFDWTKKASKKIGVPIRDL